MFILNNTKIPNKNKGIVLHVLFFFPSQAPPKEIEISEPAFCITYSCPHPTSLFSSNTHTLLIIKSRERRGKKEKGLLLKKPRQGSITRPRSESGYRQKKLGGQSTNPHLLYPWHLWASCIRLEQGCIAQMTEELFHQTSRMLPSLRVKLVGRVEQRHEETTKGVSREGWSLQRQDLQEAVSLLTSYLLTQCSSSPSLNFGSRTIKP